MVLLTRKDTVSSKRIYDGSIISLRLDTLQMPDGSQKTREIIEHNGGVTIACQPSPKEVMLIKQYRYPIDEELFELPAGRIEKGEDPFICAQRELIEETGYKAQTWQELVQMYTAPGFCNELLRVYKATDITFVGKSLDDDEETDVIVMSLEKAWQLVLSGSVRDAKTIAGLALLIHPTANVSPTDV